ncbi:Hypothetical protein R9X50_00217400 [Acrodontium crateriforme]|uniref:Uncharacterized protein n=1 Tax=Acrodontium crateriforme TaxID=150365 RepID=A0AAQ3R3A6_9PEZI|nr:Hypothetical protein R9X50_00217400 [Acrodontium crateriforme]
MTSTPPPPSECARTPPTPLHGPRYDSYEPYSPRRSKRSSAHSNPYSSFNSDRSPRAPRDSTPPPTLKHTRFARAPAQLSSPPSSPISPVRHAVHKTPRKTPLSARRFAAGAYADSDHGGPSNSRLSIDPVAMLPTPSKTPSKKRHVPTPQSTARILSFQPNHINDAMPSARKIKKHNHSIGFDLYDEDREAKTSKIKVFTDTNARIPEMDDTEENPFLGPKVRPQRRSSRKSKAELESDAKLKEAVKNGEGVLFAFRGKKILRKFVSEDDDEETSSVGSDLGTSLEHRMLTHQAGAAAGRPLTRSSVKPRLLFPSEDDLRARDARADYVDEEALTDIEVPAAHNPQSTIRSSKSDKGPAFSKLTPSFEDDSEADPISLSTETAVPRKANKKRSPFDSWQRTKGGVKRPNDSVAEGPQKRTRTATNDTPT